MTKTYTAVLKSSLVMLVLFAVAGSGVAQAQRCKAYESTPKVVRAEGITETVGGIELRCVAPSAATDPLDSGAEVPEMVEITVELNTRITSPISDDRGISGEPTITYDVERLVSGGAPASSVFSDAATLSDDGTTLEFEIASDAAQLGLARRRGLRWISSVSEPTPPRWEMMKMSPRW